MAWGWPVDLSVVSPYVRTVKTASPATAVQVVFSEKRGAKKFEHVGSARDEEQLPVLRAKAQQIIESEKQPLDLGLVSIRSSEGQSYWVWEPVAG